MEYAYFRPVRHETLSPTDGSTDNDACFVSRNGYNRAGTAWCAEMSYESHKK